MSGPQTPGGGSRNRPPGAGVGVVSGVVSGALALSLLWVLSTVLPTLLALFAAVAVAGTGGAVAASRIRRGPAGANLAGLCSLGGVALVAIPLLFLESNSGLEDSQIMLFGLAIAAISAMGGQIFGATR